MPMESSIPNRCGEPSALHTRLIALVHASNVTGALQPIEEVGRIAAEHGVFYLVDAAQSLGHLPIDVPRIGAHLLAAPAHKGLLGPSGLGILYIAPGCEEHLLPLRQGGTGTQSDEDRQPDTLPDKYEPGNLNVPAVLGLGEGDRVSGAGGARRRSISMPRR